MTMNWQDPTSIHITIQSSLLSEENIIGESIILNIINDLEKLFNSVSPITCTYLNPYFAKLGMIGVCDQADQVYKLRQQVTDIWHNYKLLPVLKEEYWNFPYSFLGRFTSTLTQEERHLLANIPVQNIKTSINNIKLCLSDKFISPDTTKVIKEFVLV